MATNYKSGEKVKVTYSRFGKDGLFEVCTKEKDRITAAKKHIDYVIKNEKGETDCVNEDYVFFPDDKEVIK